MASFSESEKVIETGSAMEIFVPASDQGQNGLHISRRHLLSVKYVKEMEGELLPVYRLVQQQQIGLNLIPVTSIFELELCLAKANGFIKTEYMSSPKPMRLQTDSPTTNYVIEATPISYRFPESYDINTMQKGKNKIEKSQTERKVRGKNVSQSQEPEWRKNWIVQPRPRKNGKYDKYYYHKYSNIMCRSLVEIENFEMNGVLPKRARKDNNYNAEAKSVPLASQGTRKTSLKRKITSQSFNSCSNTEDCGAGLNRATENFLQESYDNLCNIFNDGSKSNGKKKKKRVRILKEREGSNPARMDINSPDTKPAKTEDDALVDIPVTSTF